MVGELMSFSARGLKFSVTSVSIDGWRQGQQAAAEADIVSYYPPAS